METDAIEKRQGHAGRGPLLRNESEFDIPDIVHVVQTGTDETDIARFGPIITDMLNVVACLKSLRKGDQCHQHEERHVRRGTFCRPDRWLMSEKQIH
jgi:hypothetical protein